MKFHSRWAITALFVVAAGGSTLVHAASVSGQGTWETTLQARDFDGNTATIEAYYDTTLNITWLADANYAQTSGVSNVDGRMLWPDAITWVANLDPYGSGITGWRLPTTTDVGNDGETYTNYYQGVDYGYNITAPSEMSYMFYTILGDKAYCDTTGNCPQAGWGLTNTGPFSNIQGGGYWSATEYATDSSIAWGFDFGTGNQSAGHKIVVGLRSWVVHSGDVGMAVATVPVPAAVWLFGSGLTGLFGFARKKISA